MAIKQSLLSEPKNRERASAPPPVDKSSAEAITAFTEGAEDLLTFVDEKATGKILDSFEEDIGQEFAPGGGDETQPQVFADLSFEQAGRDPALGPAVKQLERLEAQRQQGRNRGTVLDRMNAVLKTAINESPGRSDELQEFARKKFGLDETKMLVDSALKAEEQERALATSFMKTSFDYVVDNLPEAVVFNTDGSINSEATAIMGHTMRVEAQRQGILGTLNSTSGTSGGKGGGGLTQTQLDNEAEVRMQGFKEDAFRRGYTGLMSQMNAALANPDILQGQKEVEVIRSKIISLGVNTKNAIMETYGKTENPDPIKKIIDQLDAEVEGMVGDYTVADVNLDAMKSFTETATTIGQASLIEAVPAIPTWNILFSQDAFRNSAAAAQIANSPEFKKSVLAPSLKFAEEGVPSFSLGQQANRQSSTFNTIMQTTSVAAGAQKVEDLSLQDRNAVIATGSTYLAEQTKSRNSWTSPMRDGYLNMSIALSDAGIGVTDSQSARNAAEVLHQEGVVEGILLAETDPQMENKAEEAGSKALTVLNQNVLGNMRALQQNIVPQVSGIDGVVYNGQTGLFELDIDPTFRIQGSEDFGPPSPTRAPLLPGIVRRIQGRSELIPPDSRSVAPQERPNLVVLETRDKDKKGRPPLLRIIDAIRDQAVPLNELHSANDSLNEMVKLRKFDRVNGEDFQKLNEAEMKEVVASQMGIRIVNPKIKQEEQQQAQAPQQQPEVFESAAALKKAGLLFEGEDAVVEVERREGELTEPQKEIVRAEGFADAPYFATKEEREQGLVTEGAGQTEEFRNMSVKESITTKEDLLRGLLPNYDSFPDFLRTQLLKSAFRGGISGSPETIKLINQGKFEEAADEFLRNKEFETAVARGEAGVRKRMQAVADALKKFAKQK